MNCINCTKEIIECDKILGNWRHVLDGWRFCNTNDQFDLNIATPGPILVKEN